MNERDHALAASAGLQASVSETGDARRADMQQSAGALLREARQSRGVDIESLAGMLKVSVQKMQALEHDQFDQLVDPVFARALASSVCRTLGIDPLPILQRLPEITAFKVTTQNRGINAPFRSRDGGSGSAMKLQLSKPAIWLGVALLLGTLILVFLPFLQQEISAFRSQGAPVSSGGDLVEPVTTTTTTIVPAAGVSSAELAAPSLNPPAEPLAAIASASSPVSVQAQAPHSDDLIAFNARAESWVKVTDAKGVVLLNRKLVAGDVVGISGTAPLKVMVARADAIEVQVRGQSFALNTVAKNNIARFEVK
ncbi:MAG: helix-turn-helix domain-containing protein [Polaromonas sp.]